MQHKVLKNAGHSREFFNDISQTIDFSKLTFTQDLKVVLPKYSLP